MGVLGFLLGRFKLDLGYISDYNRFGQFLQSLVQIQNNDIKDSIIINMNWCVISFEGGCQRFYEQFLIFMGNGGVFGGQMFQIEGLVCVKGLWGRFGEIRCSWVG